MMNPRSAAFAVIQRCRKDGAWSSLVLDKMLESCQLDARDAALAVRLSMETLQNSRYLDFYIDYYCNSRKLEPRVRDVLRLGACQILLMEKIPGRAAIHETVELCKKNGLSHASGLVNAVLRRIEENRHALPEIPGRGTSAYLAVRFSQQDWLAERLVSQRGYNFAEAFFAASQLPAATDLQINTLKTSCEHFCRRLDVQGIAYEVSPYPASCVTIRGGRIDDLPGYAEGEFYVQDRAAAMAVELSEVKRGMRVLDACAAPGGKSFAVAMRMQGEGHIIACDIHEKKLRRIASGASRLGISCVETRHADASAFELAWQDAFDLVIADMPCSGFGVMRKKPEIRQKNEEACRSLPLIQKKILDNLSRYVCVGGTLLVATCTVLREENEAQIEQFLSEHPAYTAVDFHVGDRCSENGCYTFWPHVDGTDGFFAAKLKRIK